MRDFTDEEIAELAQWAEAQTNNITKVDGGPEGIGVSKRMGYAAIRQGCDWLLRARTLERAKRQQQPNGEYQPIDISGRKQ